MPTGPGGFFKYLEQAAWLRERYVAQHLRVRLSSVPLKDPTGHLFGYVEEIAFRQNRLILRGWARAKAVTFSLGPFCRQVHPSEERMDVAVALGCDPHVGFIAALPFHDGPLRVQLEGFDGQVADVALRLDLQRARQVSEARLRRQFLREMIPLVPSIGFGLWRKDPDLRRKVKAALRLDREVDAMVLDPRFLASSTSVTMPTAPDGPITIILPIYDAFELLPEVLRRVVAHTDLPWHLIIVEDASKDVALRPWLRDWVAGQPAGQVTLLENAVNQGFIQSVNRAFAVAQDMQRDGPVILLNSDAMVPQGWASRLTAPLIDTGVASVTPLSNDAEIFSAPIICQAVPLAPGQGDHIDAELARRVAAVDLTEVAVPTGVGFCMALSREWLTRAGPFDTCFGRGYGEEVDWCRRASAKGARHVTASNLYVEHRGGASFGPAKAAMVQQNNAIIAARYPGYDLAVQEFIRADPLTTVRLVAALAWADSQPDVTEIPVYIAHSMGGGAEDYLRGQRQNHPCSVTLRMGGATRVQIELDTAYGRLVADSDDLAVAVQLISGLSKRRVVYSCAVGDPDLRDLPGFLTALAQDAPLDILFHDYLPVSPSYTLLDADGVYRGVPQPGQEDAGHTYRCPDGTRLALAAWQALWGQALDRARYLIVFSEATRRILSEAYPASTARIILRPHQITTPITRVTPPADGQRTIGVLGAIGPQKGARVVAELSQALKGRQDVRLVLIGYIAPGFDLAPDTVVHGRYDVADVSALAAHYGITTWLIPSVWPETFSYVTHECLATGLPTMAFDLGAQGEAVARAPNGVLWPLVSRIEDLVEQL
jgi:GT2 family glycosyltransferase/glycosyltransferase involved in cell wall biosynthesis